MKMIKIIPVQNEEHLEETKKLFKEYAAELDFDLNFQNFDEEFSSLPGDYTAPEGCLLLAFFQSEIVGCVALRKLDRNTCEMKRLFVRAAFRDQGIGHALAEAVIQQARQIGYTSMRLDTAPSMHIAQNMYLSLGFREIDPYCYNPLPGAVFLELLLAED